MRYSLVVIFLAVTTSGFAQQSTIPPTQSAGTNAAVIQASDAGGTMAASQTSELELPDAPAPQQSEATAATAPPAAVNKLAPEPKRILGIMPNYRAVSAGVRPPPPTPREAFMVATKNSFDYSAFIFVGVTSLLAEGTNAHPQIGKGVDGFWGYYWRGYLDKTDGNYMVDFAMPTIFHQDERYYAMGQGGILKRGVYAATRILITPDYHGHNGFNTSEILGRGVSQGISLAYYPSSDQTLGKFGEKYAYALGRDALTNVFREFWPDISTHVLHHHQ